MLWYTVCVCVCVGGWVVGGGGGVAAKSWDPQMWYSYAFGPLVYYFPLHSAIITFWTDALLSITSLYFSALASLALYAHTV